MAGVKVRGDEMQLLSFYLIASTVYAGYLPFSATKVSARRREERRERGDMLLLAVKMGSCFNTIKGRDF